MKYALIALILGLLAFQDKTYPWKKLFLPQFEMEIPIDWQYVPMQGMDSFIGMVEGPKASVFFDYSRMGYARSGSMTVKDFAKEKIWEIKQEHFIRAELVPQAFVDTVKMHHRVVGDELLRQDWQRVGDSVQFVLESAEKTIRKAFAIPPRIFEYEKYYEFEYGTKQGLSYKIMRPLTAGKGKVGIYMWEDPSIENRSGIYFSFYLGGANMSASDEAKVIKMARSIIFKDLDR
ncbi:MAG: hypothetical protein AAFP02_16190 [Bacteroidota bacterium]